MRVGITGSWREKDQESWALRSNLDSFKAACRQVGEALAQSGAEITVGSDSAFTADRYVVEGYLSNPREGLSIRIVRPQKGPEPFANLYKRYPGAFIYLEGKTASWRHTRQQFIFDIDVLVTVGGADGTYQAGLELKLTKKRLVPIGAFGGASARLLTELLNSKTLRQPELFERLGNPWAVELASHAAALVGANQPSKILLIHGHSDDHNKLELWLRNEALADPVVMVQEFTSGQTLPEKFESLAEKTDAAIALATPDDLPAALWTDNKKARARQNVWVEVGWFWGRLGRHRVLLLVRGDIEIPSDLDGIELFKYTHSPVEPKLENQIRRFLRSVSERNQ